MADSVRGDKPEHTALPQQAKRAAEEMRHQIGIAMRALVERLQPREVVLHTAGDNRVLPGKRRIPHNGVEPAIVAREHLGELDLPVKRREAVLSRKQPSGRGFQQTPARRHAGDLALDIGAGLLARLCFVRRKKCRDHRIAHDTDG